MQFPLLLSCLLVFTNTLYSRIFDDDFKNEKTEFYLNKSKQYYITNNNDSALFYAEKALVDSKSTKNDKLVLKSYFELYYNYLIVANTKEVKRSLLNAKKLAYKINDTNSICNVHFYLANCYSENSKYDSAFIHFDKSKQFSELIDYKWNTVRVLIGSGEIHYQRGDFESALNNYLEAFKYSKTITDDNIKLSLFIDMGNIYCDDKQFEKAKSYYNQAKEIAEQQKDENTLSVLYNNLAIIYQEQSDFLKAQTYFQKSLKIEQKKGNKKGVALTLNNIGDNYYKTGEYEKAIVCLRESLATHRKLNYKLEIIYNLESLSQVALKTSNYKQAFKYLNEAINLSIQLKTKGKRSDLLKLLAEYYSKIGNNKKAYFSLLAYNSLKDSLLDESRSTKIAQLQARFESVKKEKENEILRVKNKYTQEKLEQEKTKSYFLYAFSFLTLTIIFLIVIQFRSKVKVHNKMKRIYSLLEESNSKLKIMNATKDKFFSIIAHDLRSPFNAILGFSELIKEELKTKQNISILKRYNDGVNEAANGLYNLLENLLQWANSQRGQLKFSPTQFDLHELVKCNLRIFKLRTADKSIQLNSDIKPGTMAYGDKHMVDTIVRNLLSNALKFTNSNGEVFLSAKLENERILFSVKDNGVGISKENQDKLFGIDSNFTTYGTNDESGSGLGLILCKEFVNKNGGKIWVESELNKGSCFTFSLKSI